MLLTIVDVNFKPEQDWLFKLNDSRRNFYFIKDASFYKKHGLQNPITKKELDSYDKGVTIKANVRVIEGLNIVIG